MSRRVAIERDELGAGVSRTHRGRRLEPIRAEGSGADLMRTPSAPSGRYLEVDKFNDSSKLTDSWTNPMAQGEPDGAGKEIGAGRVGAPDASPSD
jgi:hypothetical protein